MGYQKPLYLTTKRGGYYYTWRVPQSLQGPFKSRRFVKCLHTRSGFRCKKSAVKFNNAELNSYVYKSPEHGRKLTFYFCPICATTVTTTLERFSDIQIIFLGTLDNPSKFEIKTHMFLEEGMHWVGFNKDDTSYSKHRINADGSAAIPIDR